MLHLRKLLLWALHAYTHTSLRGRTRLTELLHPRVCPPGSPFVVTLDIDDVPLELDLSEHCQARMFYGFYEPNEVAFVRRILRPGQVFVDVGAHVGYYAAVASSIVGPSGEVHAFEPVPWLYGRLQRLGEQAGINGFRIWCHQTALSDREGETIVWVSRGYNFGTIVPGLLNQAEVKDCFPVRCMRLDEYFNSSERRPPDMVKIDVERAELAVLRGMAGLFEAGLQPTVLCEVSRRTVQAAIALLTRFSYEPFHCMADGTVTPVTLPLPFDLMTLAFVPRQD